jgi:hypothetical protein
MYLCGGSDNSGGNGMALELFEFDFGKINKIFITNL